MSFSTPSLKELIQQADADIDAELQGEKPLLRRSFLRALARAVAGLAFLMFGFLRRYMDNAFPWSAKGVWLLKWASWWSGFTPKAADFASGATALTGTDDYVLPQGTLLSHRSGNTYETQADATIVAGVATVQVKATEPGIAGNLAAGEKLTLISPVAGINGTTTVTADGITNGTDAETEEDFSVRWKLHVQRRSNGTSLTYYEELALEVPGVTRAWAYDNRDGAGTVAVFFVRDNDPDIIPNAQAIADVQTYIRDKKRKPAGAEVNVYAPDPLPYDMTIRLSPNTVAVQNKVTAEINDLIKRESDLGVTIVLSHVDEGISLADGEFDHKVDLPVADPVVLSNQLLVPGTLTFAAL
jgi:uncharacterized phage protein gp47/JayE